MHSYAAHRLLRLVACAAIVGEPAGHRMHFAPRGRKIERHVRGVTRGRREIRMKETIDEDDLHCIELYVHG